MSRTRRYARKKPGILDALVPESLQAFVANRLVDGFGLALMLGGIAILVSLASYNAADPSWNTASTGAERVRNLMGTPGAHIGDLLLQTIGLAGALFGLITGFWGWRILRRMKISPLPLRITLMIVTTLLGAVAFARIPSAGWMVHPFLGGAGGTLMLDHLAQMFSGVFGAQAHSAMAAVAALLAIAAMPFALAVSAAEWQAIGAAIWSAAQTLALRLAGAVTGFYDWVRHYSDPEYTPPQRKKAAIRREAKRRIPALSAEDEEDSDAEEETDEDDSEEEEDGEEEESGLRATRVVAPRKAKQKDKKKKTAGRQGALALATHDGEWELPALDLLSELPENERDPEHDESALQKNAAMLRNVLEDFNVQGDIVSIHPGPVVTLYELEPAPGTKTSRVISLSDDIARSMSATSVRSAVIPGRNVIGIELPNRRRQMVSMRDLLETDASVNSTAALPLILGKDIGGDPIIADLARMPHLLVAGTTGSGKSVAVNTMILSLLFRLPPEKCRFIMIDPKMLELSVYNDIPHLLSPVVTEPGKAVVALKWTVKEMEDRYRAMSKLGVRNIDGYNERLRDAKKKGEILMRKVQTGFDSDTGKPVYEEQPMDMTELPYIVVIVDEFADLMLVAGKDVENAIQRLAQMARAAGIHIIMATQRPSVDVITGVIKANFPTRISFQVTSKIDSRTILGEGGAEQLLGRGDMLYMAAGGRITRVHGPFVSDDEVEQVVSFLKAQGEPAYIEDVTEGGFGDSEMMAALFGEDGEGGGSSVDELYDEAVAIVAREGKASTSFIQRHLQIGYNRAARIIEEMERQGVVSRANAVGKREVLVSDFSDA
ncbi:MAG: DNA translocase FtsK 4TM domain-containing protein [Micavibrio aeruginosavorus]|nr:DNA translocase FtsK 4TM domain-containing protein [Micavibrio aeruginosavorus]